MQLKSISSISIEVGLIPINVSGGVRFPNGGLLGGLRGLSSTGIPPFCAKMRVQ